jgi:dihydrolipoamide dehydrogenase
MTNPSPTDADLVVIGGGPGGYVAALRAAQLGLAVICVDSGKTLGGTCVNIGCIPSKALLSSSEHFEFAQAHAAEHGVQIHGVSLDLARMLRRKEEVVAQNTKGIEYLFKKNKIAWARGTGTLRPGNIVEVAAETGDSTAFRGRNIIIATGSVPIQLPALPFDEERIVSSTGALSLSAVPGHLIVIGGGIIGLELGSVWRRLGARVTVVERMPTILPEMDEDVIKEATRVFGKQGLILRPDSNVISARREADGVIVEIDSKGTRQTLTGDILLVSVGRKPVLTGVDTTALGLKVGARGEILVDDQMRTSIPTTFAIGDCVGGKLLAHKAEEEGIVAAEVAAGHSAKMHYKSIPSVVYTSPEVASVGQTEAEVRATGREFRTGKFPFSANGRARSMGDTTGFVKFIADARTDELLGCHIIGPNASELIAEVVLAFEYRGSSEDIGMTVHAHPTLSEATKEAALAVLGRALHI